MKKIGLITYHNVPNFGAVLQSWAMTQILRKYANNVKLINYCPDSLEGKFRRKGWKRWLPSPGIIRRKLFCRKHLPLTQPLRTNEEVSLHVSSELYDTLVCGSDQIWMKEGPQAYDNTYMLGVARTESIRKISYAPSCGDMKDYGQDGDNVRTHLRQFHALSVRDAHSAGIIAGLGIEKVKQVLDPTLLVDFSSLLIPRRAIKLPPYIAFVGPTNAQSEETARQVSAFLKLPIVAVGSSSSVANIVNKYVGPSEWASHIAHAEFVVTSLFHGVMLSIRFKKPFLACAAVGRQFKIADALSKFGMGDRLLSSERVKNIDESFFRLDYAGHEDRLRELSVDSWNYLDAALSD